MAKLKTFAAKLAHATSGEKKVICPICNSEIQIIRIIRNKHKDGKWAPKRELVKICKCNENEILG